jgi:lipopolysaccharide export system protein LptA
VKAARAEVMRNDGLMRLEGGVEVKQANDVMTSRKLELNFGDDQVIYRAQASDDVEVRTAGAVPGAGAMPGGGGPRVLRGRKLDIFLRPGGVLQEMVAGPDAELTLFAAAPDPPEKRVLRARFLTFRFDAEGRLEELQGQKDSSFTGQPLPPSKAAPRSLVCQSFLARLDPASGEAQTIEFSRDLVFVEGRRKATAQRGVYEGPKGLLLLKEDPSVVDEDRGWQLSAQAIDLGTRSGDVVARQSVRNTLRAPAGGAGQPGLLRGPDSVATCRFFDYVAATRTAHYRDEALLRSGRDEIQAREIRVQEREEGRRRLEAEGSVRSILRAREEQGGPAAARGAKPAESVDARARALVYEEAQAQAVYRGDVEIRRGEIQIKAPEATLDLGGEGGALRRLLAGEPVEVRQGARVATGASATYDVVEGTMVLRGDKVVLKDPTQEVQGRSLTFRVGDDSIRVDGREGRTEAVFKKEPPKP